jgi:NADPH-dependent ferric siderophore reductase
MLTLTMTQVSRTPHYRSTVCDVSELSPKMRRITVTAAEIAEQNWPLGCDMAIVLTGADGREMRRRYTVRSVNADRLVIDAVLHGDGPGANWAATAKTADELLFYGPRGEIALPPSGTVLAVTDESGLPAIAALAEASTVPIRVLAEIADNDERYPLPTNADVRWLPRNGGPAGDPTLLMAAISELTEDYVYAYAITESRAVLAIRQALEDRGLHRTAIYFKGYWNLKSRPTR